MFLRPDAHNRATPLSSGVAAAKSALSRQGVTCDPRGVQEHRVAIGHIHVQVLCLLVVYLLTITILLDLEYVVERLSG